MRITKVDIYIVKSGKLRPVIVEISTDEGLTGIGEAAVAYGHGSTAAAGMVKDFVPRLIGKDPGRIEDIWSTLYDHSFWAKGGGTIVFAAISAIEQCLWDIKGKALNAPVYELLGGIVHDRLRVYANGWYGNAQTPAEFARAVERPLRDGYTALKFYPLGEMKGLNMEHVTRRSADRDMLDRAFERVKAVRDAAGPAVDIMLDLSGGLTLAETARLCRRFEELDILFVEEPVDPSDAKGMGLLSRDINIPVAAGERHYTRYGFMGLFEHRSVDIVQPDPGNTGGIMETKKIAAMAEAHNIRVAPHVCGSSLITNVALHLAANLPNFFIQELYPYFRFLDGHVDTIADPAEARVVGGFLPPPEGAGLGSELNREALRPYLWASCTE